MYRFSISEQAKLDTRRYNFFLPPRTPLADFSADPMFRGAPFRLKFSWKEHAKRLAGDPENT
jgi:hypothetical protein